MCENQKHISVEDSVLVVTGFDLSVAKLHHGNLSYADGNGDWVLTVFTALSLVSFMFICGSVYACQFFC